MDAITTDFGEVLLWSFWFFIWIAALMVWFRCLFDMFSDGTLSGWAKAGWAILLIFALALDAQLKPSGRRTAPPVLVGAALVVLALVASMFHLLTRTTSAKMLHLSASARTVSAL